MYCIINSPMFSRCSLAFLRFFCALVGIAVVN